MITTEIINEYLSYVRDALEPLVCNGVIMNDDYAVLLVEGTTDKKFFQKLIDSNKECISIKELIESEVMLMMDYDSRHREINNKEAITSIIFGLYSKDPNIMSPRGSSAWPVFGLIDRDFDSRAKLPKHNHLFITDAHDLETMIIQSDEDVLFRLGIGSINKNTVDSAVYMSYEIGILMEFIARRTMMFPIRKLYGENNLISYGELVDDRYNVEIIKVLIFINNKNNNLVSDAEVHKYYDSLVKDRELNRFLDANGAFNLMCGATKTSRLPDCWKRINGHDFLSALAWLNEEIAMLYYPMRISDSERLYREFETALIDNYQDSCFKKTDLYKKMIQHKLVKELI